MSRFIRLTARNRREISGHTGQGILLWSAFVLTALVLILLTRDTAFEYLSALNQLPCLIAAASLYAAVRTGFLMIRDRRNGFALRFRVNGAGWGLFYWSYRLCSMMHYMILSFSLVLLGLLYRLWSVSAALRLFLLGVLPWDSAVSVGLLFAAVFRRRRFYTLACALWGTALVFLSTWFISPDIYGEAAYRVLCFLPFEQSLLWARAGLSSWHPDFLYYLPVFTVLMTVSALIILRVGAKREGVYGCCCP